MQLTVFRFASDCAFHFGEHGVGFEKTSITFASDRLYAALFAHNLLTGIMPAWNEHSPDPPFRISSCLPYVGTVVTLPLPMLAPQRSEQTELKPGERKRLKKVRYVSATIFKRLLAGAQLRECVETGVLLQGKAVLIDQADLAAAGKGPFNDHDDSTTLWRQESVPHVAIDRMSNQPNYYEIGQVRFAPGCGLAVLASGNTTGLEHLLHSLGASGIGGRRSKGLGQFCLAKPATLELPDPDTECAVLLSRYWPSAAELRRNVLGTAAPDPAHQAESLSAKVNYSLVDVGGWLFSPGNAAQRRKSVRMLSEGSVVHTPAGLRLGSAVDVRPAYGAAPTEPFPHPVFRFGQALAVGVPKEVQ